MQVTEQGLELIARADPDRQWELHDGQLREKPGMGVDHNDVMFFLAHLLQPQLDRREYRLRVNAGHVQYTARNYYTPDIKVIPVAMDRPKRGRPGTLEFYPDPRPLVVEVWSHSTGTYDIETKPARYQTRGDHEIWRLHPDERTLTTWRRQPTGEYKETLYRGGVVPVKSLPGVSIDLDAVFADLDLAAAP